MSKEAKLELGGKVFTLPTFEGSEGEKAVDVSSLRANTNYITLDDGYGNTGSCASKVTFIDGDKGILRYRGIPIEEMAEKSNFIETAYLVIYGGRPDGALLESVSHLGAPQQVPDEGTTRQFARIPAAAHPMALLYSTLYCASSVDYQ